jgi:peptidyl-dipeptidase A
MRTNVILLLTVVLAACGNESGVSQPKSNSPVVAATTVVSETATEFLQRANAEIDESDAEQGAATWVSVTYINRDTALLSTNANARQGALMAKLIDDSGAYDDAQLAPETARHLGMLRRSDYMPEHMSLPSDPDRLVETTAIQRKMEGMYGAGRYCPDGEDSCKTLEQLSDVLAHSRDYDETLAAWLGWRTVSVPMREDYQRFAELTTEGALELGYNDMGEMWRSGYDMSPAQFESEVERLWGQAKPLYEQLHCYVRNRLADHYGDDRVPRDGPIPAHLLGNMWSQEWTPVYDLLEPFPGAGNLDVTAALEEQGYDARRVAEAGERFFVSMGMPELPETFWERSMLQRPRDRDVVCHASAWNMDPANNDVRIKQCIVPTEDEFTTVHHELGHVYYYLAYNHLPNLYRKGAHDGFHEGIGDTLNLSMTPGYYQQIGLIDEIEVSDEAVINRQLKLALEKIAALPWTKLVDQWRWGVFSGEIPPEQYNEAWWELRTRYQGIAPPVERSEDDFDPGAKYHIPGNTPYTRYFLARILQFQFHKALCDAAGYEGPLHSCSIYDSKEAGEKLWNMMSYGTSQPWQDTLEAAIGSRDMDASAIIDYFQPLMGWLETQNEGKTCGW